MCASSRGAASPRTATGVNAGITHSASRGGEDGRGEAAKRMRSGPEDGSGGFLRQPQGEEEVTRARFHSHTHTLRGAGWWSREGERAQPARLCGVGVRGLSYVFNSEGGEGAGDTGTSTAHRRARRRGESCARGGDTGF